MYKPLLRNRLKLDFERYKHVYLMAVPVIIWYIAFCYWPLAGNVIAFKNFKPKPGIWGSPWVGFQHFQEFFGSYYIGRLLRNTLLISVYGIIFSFPAPILLALLINEVKQPKLKRTVQTITYLPYFISMIVICGMLIDFLKKDGVITSLLSALGMSNENYLMRADTFRSIYILSDIWQHMGWNSIIYLAALSSIDQELYEAARIDGAGRFKQTLHVTMPGLTPTIMVLLIIRVGAVLNVGYEKIILLYNASNAESSDVISSFVYRRGILESNYSYTTAVDLFNSVISFALVAATNRVSKRQTEYGLW
jgi:putative aldouronate transport system permease protein